MVELKQDNAKSADEPPHKAATKKRELHITPQASKGEKLYDWAVYKGLNFWVNLGSSIAITDYFHNHGGRKHLNKWIDNAAQLVEKTGIAKGPTAYKQTKVIVETGTLLSGGWLLLVPMKIMEDNKRPMVHWLNKKLGTPQKDADGDELPVDEIVLAQEQPKQSWAKVIGRRALATGAVLATGSILNKVAENKNDLRPFEYTYKGEHHKEMVPLGGKERVTNTVVDALNKGANTFSSTKRFGKNPNSFGQRWLNFGVLDAVFTAITAGIMYATNGAEKVVHKNEQNAERKDRPNTDNEKSLASAAVSVAVTHAISRNNKTDTLNKPVMRYTEKILQSKDLQAEQSL